MTIPLRLTLFLSVAVMLMNPPANADVLLPTLFSDHMVLQRDRPVPVRGWAAAGESITVRLDGQSKTTVADANGRWTVQLDSLPATPADAPALTLEIEGRNRVVFQDVLVGEVWLCSGQSNMEFNVSAVRDAVKEIAAVDNPRIRQLAVPRFGASTPQDSSLLKPTPWEPATPSSVGHFTAVGYFFAREVSHVLDGMPVGLMNASWGGTPIQSWMPAEAIQVVPGRYESLLKAKEKELADWSVRLREIEAFAHDWEALAAKARTAGEPDPPNAPWNPGPPNLPQWTPTNLYNGMIHPLLPYAIRGALWYQGEANAAFGKNGAADYASLQADMIRAWRAAWNVGDFPFYYVQLPNWHSGEASGVSWAYFREGQAKVLDAVPNTGMAVTIDVGESENIHPANKQAVGDRLARIALRRTYGRPSVDKGPTFCPVMSISEKSVLLDFGDTAGGLVCRDGALWGFEVAGVDRKFHPAEAMPGETSVHVFCPDVPSPVAARYAWSDDPVGCNLYNEAGLPTMPFRTDDW